MLDKEPNGTAADMNNANGLLCNTHLIPPFKMSEDMQINKE